MLLIRAVEGESAVHGAGTRIQRALTVQVTGETGQPVEGAAVSFRLPDTGPTGTFPSGLRTELALTDSQGRASAWGIRWGDESGSVQVRITAVKGSARAGTLVTQYLSAVNPAAVAASKAAGSDPSARRGSSAKWIAVVIAAAGAAAGGAAMTAGRQKQAAPAAATAAAQPPITIGPPSVSIGLPGGGK